jgi:hypothetical protein
MMRSISQVTLLVLAIGVVGCSGPTPTGQAQAAQMSKDAVASVPAETSEMSRAVLPGDASGSLPVGVQPQGLVVRSGDLALRVQDLEAAERSIQKQVRAWGGFVAGSSGQAFDSPNARVNLSLRVPEARFSDAMTFLESIGTRLSKSVASSDVTGEVVDLEARQRTMLAQEESYRLMLRRSAKMSETLEIHDRLMRLRSEIEASKARSLALRRQAAYSDIQVELQLPLAPSRSGEDPNWLLQAWNRSMTQMLAGMRGVVVFAIETLAFTPYVLIAVGVTAWWRRRRVVRTGEPGL